MNRKKILISALLGAVALLGTTFTAPAEASNNAYLNAMAMQMYMQNQQQNVAAQQMMWQQQQLATQQAYLNSAYRPYYNTVAYPTPIAHRYFARRPWRRW